MKRLVEVTLIALVLCIIPISFAADITMYQNHFFAALAIIFGVGAIIAIAVAFRQHTDPKKKFKQIDVHFRKLSGKGLTHKEIRDLLVKAGWHESAIDLVLHDCHNPNGSIVTLQGYVNSQKIKGKQLSEIKELLLDAGWPSPVIDLALI
jgi:hypothetical protein